MRVIKQIIFHQTGSPNDTVESITRWHTTPLGPDPQHPHGLGWPHIGYHFVITPDGQVHKTLPQQTAGIHCKGDNANSLGVCCVGAGNAFPLDKGYMSRTMFASLLGLTRELLRAYPLIEALWGHRERPSGISQGKSCPGWNVQLFRALFM